MHFQLFMYEAGRGVYETLISTIQPSIGANKVERMKSKAATKLATLNVKMNLKFKHSGHKGQADDA